MGNYAYLCCSNLDSLYPSFAEKHYDSVQQTVACDVGAVPLMWIALFRSSDMRKQRFEVDGAPVQVEAPIAKLTSAIIQLIDAIPYLNNLFALEGSLNDYAKLMEDALCNTDRKYVTIEMQEIAWLYEDESFYNTFRAGMHFLGTQELTEEAKDVFAKITQLKLGQRFPPARAFLEEAFLTNDEMYNYDRLLGDSLFRPVPWIKQSR